MGGNTHHYVILKQRALPVTACCATEGHGLSDGTPTRDKWLTPEAVSHKARWLRTNPLLQGEVLKKFSTLHSNQHALGVSIKHVESHVLLTGIVTQN